MRCASSLKTTVSPPFSGNSSPNWRDVRDVTEENPSHAREITKKAVARALCNFGGEVLENLPAHPAHPARAFMLGAAHECAAAQDC